jgi:hypothetical protein
MPEALVPKGNHELRQFDQLPRFKLAGVLHGDKFSALEVAFQITILTPDAQLFFGVARKVDVKLHSPAPGA